MSVPPSDPVRRPLHARFSIQHLPRGEAHPPTPIFAQPNQLRRHLYLRQHGGKLLRPIRVPVDEPRQLLPRERRVLLRQRPQRDLRLRRQRLAVVPRNRPALRRSLQLLLCVLVPKEGGRAYVGIRTKGSRSRRLSVPCRQICTPRGQCESAECVRTLAALLPAKPGEKGKGSRIVVGRRRHGGKIRSRFATAATGLGH